MTSWNDLNPHGNVPAHDHPFVIPDTPTLVSLAEALGGGIYPGLGNGINDTMPNQDSVAPGFPLNLFFVVPTNQVKQQAVKLTFQPGAFRTYSGSTGISTAPHAHVGDTIQTLSIDHGHGTGNELATHFHQLPWEDTPSGTTKGAVNWETGTSQPGGNSFYAATDPLSGHIFRTGVDGGSQGDHAHTANNNGGATLTSHTHSSISNTGGEQTHIHSGSSAVSEGTSPDNMHVMVDGTDITSSLGGPFNVAKTDLDITPFVSPGTGIHTVQVTSSTNLGRITGWVRNSSIINALRP